MSAHSPKLTRPKLYAIVVLPGAVLMALEIVSSRVLAPQFGSSVYVWGSIIGVFLAAMSVGYVWGGRLADAWPGLAHLGQLLIAAAFTQVLLLLFGQRLVAVFGAWTGGSPGGTLLATTVLFGPPTILLATVAPYAVKLAAHDLRVLGGTAGHLYAISTGGSLLGTLGATFVLIPHLELMAILRLLLLATLAAGSLALYGAWREHRLTGALGVSLLIFALIGGPPPSGGDDALAHRITPYQTLTVFDSEGMRYMVSDGTVHAAVDLETGHPLLYIRSAAGALLFQPEIENLLVLGMGSGGIGTYMREQLPELGLDYVDIDPAVPEMARQLMSFDPGEGTSIHVDDARHFLAQSERRWDFIYGDTYIGHSIPFHLSTVEFFLEVEAHLAPGGVFGVNLLDSPASSYGKAFLKSLQKVFAQTYAFEIPGSNTLLFATNQAQRLSREEILGRAAVLDSLYQFEPTLTRIAGHLSRSEVDLAGVDVLVDRYAPVNHLLLQQKPARDPAREEAGAPP